MRRDAVTEPTWEALLAESNPEVRAAAEWLRGMVQRAAPEAREKVHLGWRAAGYYRSASAKSEVVSIVVQRTHCNLHFPRGVRLADPQRLLVGTGRSVRHVSVTAPDERLGEALVELVRQSWQLAAG